jgi:hypothetical protein
MGYDSEVALCMNKDAVTIFQEKLKLCATVNPELHKAVVKYLDTAERREDKDTGDVLYIWACTKWYGAVFAKLGMGYPEVAEIELIISELPDPTYKFIRIGEEFEDVTVDGEYENNAFHLAVARQIVAKY